MRIIKFFTLILGLVLSMNTYSQCNTNTTICDNNSLAGPFGFTNPSNNPSSCLDFWNGNSANYGYIILYITQSGNLNLLIDGNAGTGFLDVSIFDITGSSNPCASLSTGTEISCNYASSASGCSQFGTQFPCPSSVTAPVVQAGDVIMILVEDWSDTQTTFTLSLSNSPGSAQTGIPDATITQVGPFCENDGTIQLNAVNMGGTWTGTGVSSNGIFNPSTAGVGTHTITYTIGSNPCMGQDQVDIVVNATSNSTVNDVLCSGSSYTFPDGSVQVINSNISQVSTLTSVNGCDSIITTNLTISNVANNTTVNSFICSGDSYTFPDGSIQNNINSNISQVSTLSGVNGCDSIITTNINLYPDYNLTNNITICSGSSYTFPDGSSQTNISSPVTQVSNLLTVNGCDSIITTNISTSPPSSSTINISLLYL